jgi:antitoxin (DNA-binding transcriptional repressor) of toxin-antitoxin stability system
VDEAAAGADIVISKAGKPMVRIGPVVSRGPRRGFGAMKGQMRVTHHVDEIVPEIARVTLLRRGRIARDGLKAEVLTAQHLSHALDAPLSVDETDGYFHVRVDTAGTASLA